MQEMYVGKPTIDEDHNYPKLFNGRKDFGDLGKVHDLQVLLNSTGATLEVDGIFGDETENAVKIFQRAHGLADDGVVGKETWTALLCDEPTADPTPISFVLRLDAIEKRLARLEGRK